MKPEPFDRWHWPLVALFIIVNAAVKSIDLGYSSYFLDEAVHLWFAQMSLPELVAQARNDPNPPLYNILIAGWIRVFGVSEVATRAFSVMCVSLTAGALFHFLCRHFGLWMGLATAAIWTCTAYPVHIAHIARPYGLMVFLNVTTYGLLLGALRWGQWWRYALLALSTAAMIYAHPTAIFNLPGLFLLLLLMPAENLPNRVWACVGLTLAIALFAIYYLTAPYYAHGSANWLHPPTTNDLWRVADLLLTLQTGPMGALFWVGGLLLIIGGAFVAMHRDQRQWRPYVMGLIWAMVPFFANAACSHFVTPLFQEKYVLSAQIGIIVFAGAAVAALPWGVLRISVTAYVCWLFGAFINTEQTNGEDWRSTAALVRSAEVDSACTVIFPWYQFRSLAFYFDPNAYKDPDSTFTRLVRQGVFTSLNDVIGPDERPRYRTCNVITAYSPDQQAREAMRHLSLFATGCDTFRAESITTYAYHIDRKKPLTRFSFTGRNGNAQEDGRPVHRLGPDDEFSANIEFSTDSVAPANESYRSSAVIKGLPDLRGVHLVMSYFRHGQHISMAQQEIQQEGHANDAWEWAAISIPFDPSLHKGARLRIYVWNPGRKIVWIDEMGLSALPEE